MARVSGAIGGAQEWIDGGAGKPGRRGRDMCMCRPGAKCHQRDLVEA
jgi:hypothetical protein